MSPTQKRLKTSALLDVDASNRKLSADKNHQEVERLTTEALEPSVWRTIGRLLHEFVFIMFFVGTHSVIKWVLTKTHQEGDWWAVYLLYVSIVYASIAFTVIFGAELIVDCKRAIEFVLRRIREK